ncbi:MAG: hypothetical protein JSU94_20140 [Phycisphaerales bacterium]|nr:MAG: hypothetical protein JSU94_20140 [Phycisphaerales bacterium]
MFRRRMVLSLIVCLVCALLVGTAVVEAAAGGAAGGRRGPAAGDRGDRGDRGQRGQFGGQRFDPARMREMMEQRLREQLGATESEWKVLGPRVMKVSELNRQVSGFGRGGMFGMFAGRRGPGGGRTGGPGGDRPGAPEREQTEIEKALDKLRTTLENTSAKPEEIKRDLTALRKAREKVKQQLAVAQKQLRQVVTVRQEAQLVMMGWLD